MEKEKNVGGSKDGKSDVKKENQDYQNVPASSEKVKSGGSMKKEVRETSKTHKDGKTHNNDEHSGN
ncbi:hypothetical protein H1R16_01900 [Marnyiella aurantia]|uniref:Uncharacterized protein n=1 Tax=Marnyiella aurantia TaxID=2758037 RepID=A0A7D7R6C5_9FLAO|nr:hypothetical protein [Marnyiella aurantia]MBA5245808.1 hypothetical protein [Marnyiella aurantia]QMS98789.1 hypothetical protein H1R16_01900 [Marnyiella aurantia]